MGTKKFKNKGQIWTALLEGKRVANDDDSIILHLDNGELVDQHDFDLDIYFSKPHRWRIFEGAKKPEFIEIRYWAPKDKMRSPTGVLIVEGGENDYIKEYFHPTDWLVKVKVLEGIDGEEN